MNTSSIDSLLITEIEWIATEGLGNAIKKVSGGVWRVVKAFCEKVIQGIRSLKAKIHTWLNTPIGESEKYDAKNGRATIRNAVKKINQFGHDVVRCSGHLDNVLYRLSLRARLVSQKIKPSDESVNEVTDYIEEARKDAQTVSEKYPAIDKLDLSEFPEQPSNIHFMKTIMKICEQSLADSEKSLSGITRDLEKLITANVESKLTALSKNTSGVATQVISLNHRLSAYIAWQTAEIQRGVGKMEALNPKK